MCVWQWGGGLCLIMKGSVCYTKQRGLYSVSTGSFRRLSDLCYRNETVETAEGTET